MAVNRSGAVLSAAFLTGLALVVALGTGVAWASHQLRGFMGVSLDSSALADRSDELDLQHARLIGEFALANQLAPKLAMGALPLADAAAQMEPFLRERGGFVYDCQRLYHVTNVRLGAARYLIDKVEILLESDPSRWAIVGIRLEAEYAAMRSSPLAALLQGVSGLCFSPCYIFLQQTRPEAVITT